MRVIIYVTALIVSASCSADGEHAVRFKVGNQLLLNIPKTYIFDAEGASPGLGYRDVFGDVESGVIILQFPRSKMPVIGEDWNVEEPDDVFLVKLFSRSMDREFLARNVYDFVETGKGNIRSSQTTGLCEVFIFPDWWHVIEGSCKDNSEFKISRYVAECSTFAGGRSCRVYAEWQRSYMTFEVAPEDIARRHEIAAHLADSLAKWAQRPYTD